MKEQYPNKPVGNLSDDGYLELVEGFNQTANDIIEDMELEKELKKPLSDAEAEAALAELKEATSPEKDEFGNYIIDDDKKPLAPPVPPKSTKEGRAMLDTMTSRRSGTANQAR